MAEVDNLNFAVIVKDDQFNATIEKIEKRAEQFNTTIGKYLSVSVADVQNAKDQNKILLENAKTQEKITREKQKTLAAAQKIAEAERRAQALNNVEIDNKRVLAKEREYQATLKTATAQERLSQLQLQGTASLKNSSRILSELTSAAAGVLSLAGATSIVKNMVRVSAEFELQKTTLRAILQDAQGADKIFAQIKDLAVQSPFAFKELATYVKQLSAYSVPMGELYDTTKMLADVSAGLGVGMDRLVLAFGQIRSASFLRGQEVRQLTEAGIPILEELRKQFVALGEEGISVGDVFDKISARLVPFEMVEKVFKDMTSEGGKFYNMQAIQAETLKGKISNLKDAYEIMFSEIGEKTDGVLKGTVDFVRSLAENYEEVGKQLVELIATYGIYKTALIAVEVANNAFILSNHKVVSSIVAIGKAMTSNPYALIVAGATSVVYAMYRMAKSFNEPSKMVKDFQRESENMESAIAADVSQLELLTERMKAAKKGTESYNSAKTEFTNKYRTYINALKDEGKEVDNLVGLYDDLKEKVVAANREKFLEAMMSDADATYGDAVKKLYKQFLEKFDKSQVGLFDLSKLNAEQKSLIWEWITGGMTAEEIKKKVNPYFLGVFDWMRKEYAKVKNEYVSITNDITTALNNLMTTEVGAGASDAIIASEFVKRVQAVLGKYGIDKKDASMGMWADETTNYFEYIDALRSRYKELEKQIADVGTTMKKNLPEYQRQRKMIEELASALGISLETKTEKPAQDKESFAEYMENWFVGNLEGEGLSYKVSKILNTYEKSINDIQQKAKTARETLKADTKADQTQGEKEIEETTAKALENARVTAQNGINQLAQTFVSSIMATEGIDLSDWGDKTLAQIRDIKQKLKNAVDDENLINLIPDDLKEQAKKAGISLDDLYDMVRKILNAKIKNTTDEEIKKIGDTAKEVCSALKEIASAIGDEDLENVTEGLSGMVETLSSFATGNYIQGIAQGISTVIKLIVSARDKESEAREEALALAEAIHNLTIEAAEYNAEVALSKDVDTVWGENLVQQLRNATENLEKCKEEYQEFYIMFSTGRRLASSAPHSSSFASTELPFTMDKVKYSFNSLLEEWGLDVDSLEDQLKGIEMIISAYEEETVKMSAGVYAQLVEYKQVVQSMVDSQEAITKAISDTWSSLASNIADSMINAYLEVGDASEALGDDMKSIFADVAQDIAQDLISSFIINNILSKYDDELSKIYTMMGDESLAEDVAKKIGKMAENITKDADKAADFTNSLMKALEQYGISFDAATDSSDSLANGIKSITEDTANLLASYVNAIRADVSANRATTSEINTSVKAILGLMPEVPNMALYLAQINTNTANILSRIDSMMSNDNGEPALRTLNI